MVKKLCNYFSLFLAVLLLSLLSTFFIQKNTNAAELDLSGFEIVNSYPTLLFSACSSQCATESNWTSNAWDISVKTTTIGGIRSAGSLDFKKGDIIEVDLEVRSEWEPSSEIEYFIVRMGLLGNGDFDLLGYQEIWDSSYVLKQFNGTIVNPNPNTTYNYYEYGKGYLYKVIKFTFVAKRDGKYQFKIGAGSNESAAAVIINGNLYDTPITQYGIRTRLNNLIIYRNIGLEQQRQEQQDREEQNQLGEDSQNDSNSAQQQTNQGTQNLLGFLGSFFGAFTSAQATNCNMDWGMSEYGFGKIDMCQTDIPAVFSGILSIITLLVVLPMIYWLIHSIINAFKEFQE